MGIKLDIGCQNNTRPGFVGLDIEACGQKYVRDIRWGLPFSDNVVSEVNMSHVLEHLRNEDVLFLIHEIYRVCHHKAKVHIRVPHADSVEAKDPTHNSYWNENSLRYFQNPRIENLAVPSAYTWSFQFDKVERQSWELHVELIVDKPNTIPEVETAKVSIITVVFNQLQHTRRFIESLYRWTKGVEFELIVVDSGSDKETGEYLAGLSYPGLKTVRFEDNIGWIKGINEGYKHIAPDSSFVIFSNNDIVLTEQAYMTKLLRHFTEEVGAVGPTTNYVIGRQFVAYNHPGILEEPTNTLIGFFLCIRRKVLDEIGLLDESFGIGGSDDYDICLRIKDFGYTLLIARDVFVHHAGSKTFMEKLGMDGYNEHWKAMDKKLEEKWGKKKVSTLFESPAHVCCCIPMRTDYVHRLFALRFAGIVKPWKWSVVDAPRQLVHDARNALVEWALSQDADEILFLDDDTICVPHLYTQLHSHDAPVVSALVFGRQKPHSPCIYEWKTDEATGILMCEPAIGLIKRGIQKVDATGFGAVLIKSEVFRKLPKPWFRLDDNLGEDLYFSKTCYDAGIDIFCDTDLVLQHISDCLLVDENTYFECRDKGITGNFIYEDMSGDKIEKKLVNKE